MVIVGLTGNKDATPDAIAQYATDNGYYVDGVGTAWSLMTAVGSYGVIGQETTLSEDNIYNELENGNLYISQEAAALFSASFFSATARRALRALW